MTSSGEMLQNKGNHSEVPPRETTKTSTLDNAVLMLPLLADYLRHYIDMLDTSSERYNTSSGTNSSSSASLESFESGSPTGSLGLLLKNTASYANNIEQLALASLQTLHILLSCDNVRNVLLYKEDKGVSEISPSASNAQVSSFN